MTLCLHASSYVSRYASRTIGVPRYYAISKQTGARNVLNNLSTIITEHNNNNTSIC